MVSINGVGQVRSKHHRGTTMEHYAGIDVSLEYSSVCVVDASGKIVREGKVASEPAALIVWFGALELSVERIGLEAGPLSQWLYAGLRGILRGFGLKVGQTTARSFAARIEQLVAGHPSLEAIAQALLAVHAVLLREFNGFEKRVRTMARSNLRAKLLMTTPAVGPIVALTYACAIADPGRVKSSKAAGPPF